MVVLHSIMILRVTDVARTYPDEIKLFMGQGPRFDSKSCR